MNRCFKLLILFLGFASFLFAQMGMPGQAPIPSKEKKIESFHDPIVPKNLAINKLDNESEAALKRSQKPGVLKAENALPNHVDEIRITGTQKVEPEAILVLLKTHIGEQFNSAHIAQDIRQIFKLGLFTQIEVKKEPGPNNSWILDYHCSEKSTISQVQFIGNLEVSESDLQEAINLKPYQVADMGRIKENAEKIRKLYISKGFLMTHVSYETKAAPQKDKPEQDWVNVIFHIEEDAKTKIDLISILGNHALSSDEIKEHLHSKEKHPLSFITQWGIFNEDILEIDTLIIEQLYQEQGYLNVQVSKPRVSLSPDKTRLSIYISLIEGQSYNLGSLKIQGNLLGYSPEYLRSKISLQEGDTFNKTKLMQDILAIQDIYRDKGYAYVNITPEPQIEDQYSTVNLNLDIDPGPLVYFGRFDIKGNSVTVDEVIRREMRVYEGELYSASLLRLSEQRLNQLGYFETVRVNTKPSEIPNEIDIEIEVKEKRLGSFSLGGSYATGGEGFIFQTQIAQNNLFGRGQNITAAIQWSAYRRIFELSFMDPYLFQLGNEPMAFSIRAYNMQRFLGDYYRASTGGEIGLGYPIGNFLSTNSVEWYSEASPALKPYIPDFENLRFFLAFIAERVQLEDSLDNVNYWGWHLYEPRYTTALRPVLQMDQRNNRLFPSAGYFLELRTELANAYLGSALLNKLESKATSNNFIRYGITTRGYYNFDEWFFLKNWVLKLNIDLGLLDTFGTQIISENFRLGGIPLGTPTGLRGYSIQSIGPSIHVSQTYSSEPVKQVNIGGNKQILANLELEFPLIKPVNIFGVFFFDLGNVYAPNENLFYIGEQDFKTHYPAYSDPLRIFYGMGLYSATGFGMRWVSPFGVMRFEWGFPLVRRPHGTPGMPSGDPSMQFLFTIGQSF